MCLDTSAWLEYLNDGPHGPRVKQLLDRPREAYTPAVVVAEIIEAARRRKNNTKVFLEFLLAKTRFLPVTPAIARRAGRLNAERADGEGAWTLLESLVLATARQHKLRLVTRDPIYEALDDVEFLASPRRAAVRDASA
ncbi:MAG: PIN domain-containing protein [Euryarchaeota archaeon]|nr:PIN domain-containing protein [Euryarchaeota archaeon]